VLVTHNMQYAARAQNVIVMDQGNVVEQVGGWVGGWVESKASKEKQEGSPSPSPICYCIDRWTRVTVGWGRL
jgi:hypothetical protein